MKKFLLFALCSLLFTPAAHAAKFLVMAVPSSNQVGSYSRPLEVERFPADKPFTQSWEYQDGLPGVDQVRLKIRHPDGETITFTPWVTISGAKRASFTLTLPKGRYAIEPEGTGNKSNVMSEAIVVGDPGPTESVFWSCRTRFEFQYGLMGATPCDFIRVNEWPPKITKWKTVLPAGLQPFPQVFMKTEEFAKLAWVYDLHGYGKSRRNFVSLPNPTETHALSHFPVYFRASMDGARIPLTDGYPPVARYGQFIDAIPHPQGRGFYVCEVQGRCGLLETTGRYIPFFGYNATDSDVPYYSELTVSNVQSDRDFFSARKKFIGNYGTDNPQMRRVWGFVMWPSPAPHDKGLHQGCAFDTFRHVIRCFDHREAHDTNDPEGPGPGRETRVWIAAGTYNKITRPCFDHPWQGRFDPLDKRTDKKWLYWTVRGGQPSSTDPTSTPEDPGRARICRAEVTLATGEIGPAEVWLESAYDQLSEMRTMGIAGGEFAQDGAAKVRARFPEIDPVTGKPGFILPNSMAFDAEGNLLFAEQCAHRLRVVDRNKNVTTRHGTMGKPRTCNEVTFNIDFEGVLGPAGTVYGGTYGVDSDFVIYPNGQLRRFQVWTGLTPMPNKDMIGDGPMQQVGVSGGYPWLHAPGNKALPVLLVGHNSHGGVFIIGRRTPDQGLIDIAKAVRGIGNWKNPTGGRPALALTGGPLGLTPTTAVGAAELGTWDLNDAKGWLMERGYTETQADETVYWARARMRYKEIVTGADPPDPPPDVIPPAPTLVKPPEFIP